MHLGTLLTHLASSEDAALALTALGDLGLYAAVLAIGEQHAESPGEYVSNAAGRFAAHAGDQDWLALVTAADKAEDPGQAALGVLVRWALERDRADDNTDGHAQVGQACRCAQTSTVPL